MRLDDRAADRQAHAEPAGLAGDEAIEDALQLRLLDPSPRVLDGDLEGSGVESRGLDAHVAQVVVGHGFAGVDHDVQDHLLELDDVTEHAREVVGETEPQRDPLPFQVLAQEAGDFANHVVEVQRLLVDVFLPEERAQMSDHL